MFAMGLWRSPLTTLGENLLITLQDAEGNEISHTGSSPIRFRMHSSIVIQFNHIRLLEMILMVWMQELRPDWWLRKVFGMTYFPLKEVGMYT